MARDHYHRPPGDLGPAFRWAVGLNTTYVIVEGMAGWITGSLALLADAAHNLTDVAGLLIAWGAAVLAKRATTSRHSWGLGRSTILAALLFLSARKGDLNARGAFLHMAADAAVSGAVVLAAAGILLTGWDWLDPAVAIAVSLLIAVTAAGLFREALHLSLDGVPFEIDCSAIADWLSGQD